MSPLRRGLLCLLFGAFATIGGAWALHYLPSVKNSGVGWTVHLTPRDFTNYVLRRDDYGLGRQTFTVSRNAPDDVESDALRTRLNEQIAPMRQRSDVELMAVPEWAWIPGRDDLGNRWHTTIGGWPFPCIRMTQSGAGYVASLTAGAPLPGWPAHPLPFRVLWLGLAVNTAVYAALLACLMLAWSALRHFLRRRRGGCHVCGYDLRDTRDRCPECGGEPPARAVPAP